MYMYLPQQVAGGWGGRPSWWLCLGRGACVSVAWVDAGRRRAAHVRGRMRCPVPIEACMKQDAGLPNITASWAASLYK